MPPIPDTWMLEATVLGGPGSMISILTGFLQVNKQSREEQQIKRISGMYGGQWQQW